MMRYLLLLALATAAPGADFLNLRTGRVFRVSNSDASTLADFRSPGAQRTGCYCLPGQSLERCHEPGEPSLLLVPGQDCGIVEMDADKIPIEAIGGVTLNPDGSRGYAGHVKVDLSADRGDDPRPEVRWDAESKTVVERQAGALATYRASIAASVLAQLTADLAVADAKLVAMGALERAPPPGVTGPALAAARAQLQAERDAIAARLAGGN